ncbi:MAG: hypothetical protein JW828_16375 [Sedimentisphaerales bacterium]|nr:hypothetical protein [Sedimentisphaerales bacterium]
MISVSIFALSCNDDSVLTLDRSRQFRLQIRIQRSADDLGNLGQNLAQWISA